MTRSESVPPAVAGGSTIGRSMRMLNIDHPLPQVVLNWIQVRRTTFEAKP
ncbi:MAG TPA: hypothetical protein VFT44_10020 [Pyrinomonadaceae bacterium]|nr:hypothetical protein [Pyrinomonadaceae bacterium]